jgi:hypothetical protein
MADDRRRRDEQGWEEDQRGRREARDVGSERYAGRRFGSEERSSDWARSDTERDWGRREEVGKGGEYGRGYDRDQDYERSGRFGRSYGRQHEDQDYPEYGRQAGGMYGRPESGEGSSRTFSRQYEDQGYPDYSRQSRRMYGQPEGGRGFEQTYGHGHEQSRNWTDEGRLQGFGFGQGTHSGKGPKGYSRSDDRIREDVCDRLTDDAEIDASEIDVKVSDCEVTLAGTVDSREAKRRAEDCAERVSGVRNVQNNIRVQQSGTPGAMSSKQPKSRT